MKGSFVELTKHKGATDFRLGGFGLSERGTAPAGFLSYQDNPSISMGWNWPSNAKCFAEDLLGRYGFDLGEDWLTFGQHEPADLSLRFTRTDGVVTGLTYRVRVVRNSKAKPPKSGDFLLEPHAGGKKDTFKIRLRDEVGGSVPDKIYYAGKDDNDPVEGWLRTGAQISADCDTVFEIDEEAIWSDDRTRGWTPKVALRLHWAENVDAIAAAPVEEGMLFAGGLLAQANWAFESARAALPAGEAGQPHSFFPALSLKKAQHARFTLYGSPIAALVESGTGLLSWGRPTDKDGKPPAGPWKRPPMRLGLARSEHLIASELKGDALQMLQIKLTAADMSFFENAAAAFDLTLSHDKSWPPASVDSVEDGEPFFASFAAVVTSMPASWRGRLAALEFMALENLELPKTDELLGHLRIGGAGQRDGYGSGRPPLIYPKGRVSAEFRIVVPVSVVQPVGIDLTRFDRIGRAAPLLIPLSPPPAQEGLKQGRFWLSATETLAVRHDRQLRADILENMPDSGRNSDFVVLSSEPFSVFRFRQQPLGERGRDDTAAVAVYSGDDRIWQYRTVAPYYRYIMPPQAIGESADKPRRLEIHDLVAEVESPPRPFKWAAKRDAEGLVHDQKGERIFDEEGSSLRRRAVEQRLTPSAEIWISPSDVERGYFMPEATSYEIFRQAGAYGLGAALAFLRAEFLYGMPVGIDVSKERGAARGARVAEIEALVGRLTGPAREPDADRDLAGRWSALRAAVARRPERLEIWARDTGSTIDFTPARFSDGVRFALRGTALHRPPLIDKTGATDNGAVPESAEDFRNWPKVGTTRPEYKVATETERPVKPRHHPQGLSGGALWPVESINLFNVLLEEPQSVGGTIEQIALSPQGGDAVQKAEFLNGVVAVISETRNGRVQRQQVEVIGRICALWHRAKHVVVYERTVNPSAQFAPKLEEDPDRTRSRRPILRKVREYIELLQPVRSYPDFDTATQRSAGFLERVRFNANIINVDSAWSSEVGDFGWQIPLWNRQAARERPQVYPMPDVAFVSTAEGEGDKPCVAQDCRDTDMLFFFADFKAGSSDTDQWKPRIGLDYVNLPTAKAIADAVDSASNAQPEPDTQTGSDPRRLAVSRFLPGLRRFTWRLAPAAQKTAINAGRAGKPVFVGLDSVSFMRAGHVDSKHKELSPTLVGALTQSKAGLALGTLPGLGYWSADGSGVEAALTDLSKVVGKSADGTEGTLIEVIKGGNPQNIAKAMGDLGVLLTGQVKTALTGKLAGAKLDELAKFNSGIASGALCDKLKSDAVNMIRRKEMLISSALQDWVGEIDDSLAEYQKLAATTPAEAAKFLGTTRAAAIAVLTDLAIAHIRPLFAEASQDIARIEEGVEKARAVLLDVEVEIDLVVARARERVAQFNAGYDKDKPWSPDRRRAFRAGVDACVRSVVDDIGAAINEAAQRLATELNNASQALAGHVAKFLKQVEAARLKADVRLASIEGAADSLLDQVDGKLESLQAKASDVDGQLPALIKKVADNQELEAKAPQLKADLLKALEKARQAVKSGHTELSDLRQRAREVDDLVDSSLGGIEVAVANVVYGIDALGNSLIVATDEFAALAKGLSDNGFDELKSDVEFVAAVISQEIDDLVKQVDARLAKIGSEIDAVVLPAMRWLDATLADANAGLRAIPDRMLPIVDDIHGALGTVKKALAPDALLEGIVGQLINAALDTVLQPLAGSIDPTVADQVATQILLARKRLQFFVEELAQRIREIGAGALGALAEVTEACKAVSQGVTEVEAYFAQLAGNAEKYLEDKVDGAYATLQNVYGKYKDAEEFIAAVRDFDRAVRALHNDLGRLQETAEAYGDRVLDAAGKLDDGGLLAAPNNILKLYSAVTSAPELAALKADIDRIRSSYDELSDIIETTRANALFDRLSDELKAIGLSLPFDKIGDSLVPADLRNFNIGAVFRNFGGAKLDRLFKGYRIPDGVRDAVKVTHDFDKKQARAWVQVDINAPFPGRRSLFSLGIFKADFVDMLLTGRVRLDASKDQEKVSVTGFGRIGTAIDVVVSGQSMVRFDKFGLAFTKESGIDIEFDPKNVRLNPQFKFIQDFLSTIFPELPGGLEWIRDNGIPVGVQHDFAIPNLSLNFGTSGVSNISLENHFKLVAFPDFMLANRFNLSTVERPFIFSIFIIGGTGYMQVEAEYKPVRDELTVIVDAGAGGSAQLAFAFGPFTGQVFITLSGVLSYRKMIGRPGGGLSISVVLVIAGHVDVAGIVTVGITLMLRMAYRDNGQIDADGTLTVTIRISKFFRLTARAQAKYKLRGGKSETSVSTSTDAELEGKAKEIAKAAEKVKGAMN